MLYKSSKFNFFTESEKGGILVYNSYRGLQSLHRIEEKDKDEAISLLSGANKVVEDSELKEKLIKNNFLVSEDTDELKQLQLLYVNAINHNMLQLCILPTEQCNFRCKYCYESFKRGAMSEEIQDGIVAYVKKNLHNFSALSVSWFGGEPLVALPIVEKLSERLIAVCQQHHKPYIANVTSNGYLLTADVVKRLLKCKITSYTITVDGVKEVHDSQKPLSNGQATFDKVIGNLLDIKKNVKSKLLNITIRTNFSVEMLKYVPRYVEEFHKRFGDDPRFVYLARPAGDWGGDRVKDFSEQLFSEDAFSAVFECILKQENALRYSTHFSFLEPCGSMCIMSFVNSYLIDSMGNIRKCSCDLDSKENIVGKVKANGEFDLDKNKLAKWVHYFDMSGKCKDCSFAPCCLDNSCLANYAVNRAPDGECHVYEKKYLKYILKLCEKTEKVEVL